VFDARTLAAVAVVDGVAPTNLRTPAVSLVAARRLALREARRLVVQSAAAA
jgi:ornithine cyclodeaminase/alanine dehydrogenase-like protein (mu-crystallin family)